MPAFGELRTATQSRPLAIVTGASSGIGFELARYCTRVLDTNVTGTLYFDAIMRGDREVITGWGNKLRAAIASVTPNELLAEQHRKMAEPGNASRS